MSTIRDKGLWVARAVMVLVLLLSTILSTCVSAQSLSLTEAYQLLESNYPSLRNADLNDQILHTELDIIDLGRKPSINLRGSAGLQSETTNFGDAENVPISIDIPLYNARAYGEVNYTLYYGGRLDAQKTAKAAAGKLANQQLRVDAFALRARINQLFLGVLLNRERQTIFATTLADLEARKEVTNAAVELGAVLESELLQLEVRQVEIEARAADVTGTINQLLASLSTLIGREVTADVELTLPDLGMVGDINQLDRPELKLFDLQRNAIQAREDLIEADTKPLIAAFAQVGVGLPNPLNLFDTGVSPYAVGGVSFQWKLKDWGKSDKQKQLLQLETAKLQNVEATFRFNLNAGIDAYQADLERLGTQRDNNRRIADLQAEILTQMAAQLDNGVITATDYLAQANAELLARQALRVDEMRLLERQLNFLNERGGF